MGQKPADIPEDVLQQLYLEEKLTQYQIAERLGCSQGAIWRRLKKYGIPMRSKAESELMFSRYASLRHEFNGDSCLKAYMLGFCKGDMHVWIRDANSQTIRIMSTTTKSEQVKLIQELFSPFGRVYTGKPDSRRATHMAAYVDLSFSFLLDEKDDIPAWITSDEETFFAFFAGYIDAEGHIGVYNKSSVFKIDCYEKNILFASYNLLLQVGIVVSSPSMIAHKGSFNGNSTHRYHNDMWRLQIASKSSLLKLFRRIRPYLKHTKRIADMEAAIQNIEWRNAQTGRGYRNRE